MLGKRLLALLILVAVLSLPLSAVGAQGPTVFCGDLSAEDCAIITQSQAAMMNVSSTAFDFTLDMGLDMAPEVENFAMTLAANGALAVDPATLAELNAMAAMTPEEALAMMDQLPTMLPDLARSVWGEATFTLTLTPELMAEFTAETGLETLALSVAGVDGVLYADISPFLPAEMEGMPGWMGIDLGALFEGLPALMDMEGMDMGDILGEMGDMSAIMESDFITQMQDPAYMGEFATITRLADAAVMGQTVAVFETTMDFGAMFGSEAFMEYMNAVVEMQMQMMAEQDIPDMEMISGMLSAMFENFDMSVVEWIGLDDYYAYHAEFNMAFDMNFAALAEMMPPGTDMSDAPDNFAMTFNMALDLSAINEPVSVTAPEGAQVIDPMMFLGGMDASSG